MNQGQQKRLAELVSQPVQWQCDLSRYTTFAIGGLAEALINVHQLSELQPLLWFLAEGSIPWRIIGKGSNLLVRDEGFSGVILRLGGEFAAVSEQVGDDGLVVVRGGGGGSLARLSWHCSERGLTGLEFGCGIPGTLGGAVIMNAGAWGQNIGSVLRRVKLMTAEGEINLSSGDLNFSYRCWKDFSRYQGRAVVAMAELALQRGETVAIRAYCSSLQEKRKATQPNEYANAGSFFKNPPNDSAGRLIEASGLKGLRVGGAMVSEGHCNFLVNTGGATASDVLRLMQIVQDKVKRDSGVFLEPEVHFI
ncbi:MAG: UDP-N-acetylmuramate dehydrogenase [Proteobacteria bacterium]|nr:UDP-N-acetylmuramate dehydrogenase [Pseudomonadota bacterium]